jgi:hypothetical protein
MGASSEAWICNLALTRLGNKQQITSLTQGGTIAPLCNLHYAHCRDTLLRGHYWNFAIKRQALSQDSGTPNHEFAYRYQLPTDCLRVVRTSWEAEFFGSGTAIYSYPTGGYDHTFIPYRIENGYLLTDETAVSIEYVAQITDTTKFDDLFVDVLAQRLAAELCPAISDNTALTQRLWQIYAEKLREARTIDGMEGSPRDVLDTSGWIMSRI